MTRTLAIAVLGLAFSAAAVGNLRARHVAGTDTGPKASPAAPEVAVTKRHKATGAMIAASSRKANTPAPSFEAKGSDGDTYVLADLNAKWPVALVFIKDGCPCSKSAEPYFQQLHAAAGGWVPFLGVIDGDEAVAQRWVEENGTPFPVVADPDKTIIRAYGIENSAYVALLAPGGRIEKLWPGYSADMLREITDKMAQLSGKPIELIETRFAPDELYSGCPFD